MPSRFQATLLRPTPFLKALEAELVSLLRREGPLDIHVARRRMGVVMGDSGKFDKVLERAVKRGLVEVEGDILRLIQHPNQKVKKT